MENKLTGLPKSVVEVGRRCCGCGVCATICPKRCVSIEQDDMGFPISKVDKSVCISCGACVKVCPVYSDGGRQEAASCQWVISQDEQTLVKSSSGGVFSLLAKDVLANGGVVYGARLSEDCKLVFHARAENESELEEMRGSKYVQSLISDDVYRQVAHDLKSGRRVLWTGVPCQASACVRYLVARKVDTNNLLCVDVICHGVPSPEIWRKWILCKEEKRGAPIERTTFRDKVTGWPGFSMTYRFRSGEIEGDLYYKDWYYAAFNSNLMLRDSCFDCPSKRSSGSDITIGDFWGFQQIHPDVDCSRGVSAVVANTPKGDKALGRICTFVECGPSNYNEIYAGNPSLEVCPRRPQEWGAFRRMVSEGAEIPDLMERWSFRRSKVRVIRDGFVRVIKRIMGPKLMQTMQAKRFEARKG